MCQAARARQHLDRGRTFFVLGRYGVAALEDAFASSSAISCMRGEVLHWHLHDGGRLSRSPQEEMQQLLLVRSWFHSMCSVCMHRWLGHCSSSVEATVCPRCLIPSTSSASKGGRASVSLPLHIERSRRAPKPKEPLPPLIFPACTVDLVEAGTAPSNCRAFIRSLTLSPRHGASAGKSRLLQILQIPPCTCAAISISMVSTEVLSSHCSIIGHHGFGRSSLSSSMPRSSMSTSRSSPSSLNKVSWAATHIRNYKTRGSCDLPLQSSEYTPPVSMSSRCVPLSATCPSLRTMILSLS